MAKEHPETIAIINGRQVTREKFTSFVLLRKEGVGSEDLHVPKHELFREFVIQQLVLQEAARKGVWVDEDEAKQQLRNWLPEDQVSSPALTELARDFLRSQEFLHESIHLQVQLSLQELRNYYRDHQDKFVVEDGVHLLEILVDDSDLARQLHDQLRPGDARTFKRVANLHSQGARAEKGGDLGVFRRGELPEEFEKVIFSLKPGQVSSVFESNHGFHIFMIEEFIRRHPQKFYEVQKEIFERLTAEKERAVLDQYLTRLIRNASIQVHDESLNFEW